MRSAFSAAGIEPTETNLRQCLPALAFAKSQACLEANRLTYAADNYLCRDLSAPLAGLADDNQSRPRPDKSARTVGVPASKEPGGAHWPVTLVGLFGASLGLLTYLIRGRLRVR